MDGSPTVAATPGSVTPATAALNRSLAAAPGPRLLTEEEQRLLRLSAKEIVARIGRRRS